MQQGPESLYSVQVFLPIIHNTIATYRHWWWCFAFSTRSSTPVEVVLMTFQYWKNVQWYPV
jgi:hypothetical protein